RSYPYRPVGILLFRDPATGADGYCSAAAVAPRLVLTAGHCVHRGSGGQNGFYTNFMFIPAYRNGTAPFGAADWYGVAVTNTWVNGGGVEPNAADYALVSFRDQVFQGSILRVGDVTGWLGTLTLTLSPNHVHMLGYASNLDQGSRMHQVTAE